MSEHPAANARSGSEPPLDPTAGGGRFADLHSLYQRRVANVPEAGMATDTMFQGDPRHYRNVGQSAWRCIAAALLAADVPPPQRILDLPCGHGRVLRVLKAAFPDAALTACDLDEPGVRACAEHFGATSVVSQPDLDRVSFAAPFDLIWCGSLVTHLDPAGWLSVFRMLARALAPGGVAVVTTHGRWVAYRMQQGHHTYNLNDAERAQILRDYEQRGFGYCDYGEQAGYGVSLSQPSWVLNELAQWWNLRVISLCERQWDRHQDVLAVQRVDG
ncbi:MAG: trans-aconitate 2-methyltransferase [Planctomycetota bacterium]